MAEEERRGRRRRKRRRRDPSARFDSVRRERVLLFSLLLPSSSTLSVAFLPQKKTQKEEERKVDRQLSIFHTFRVEGGKEGLPPSQISLPPLSQTEVIKGSTVMLKGKGEQEQEQEQGRGCCDQRITTLKLVLSSSPPRCIIPLAFRKRERERAKG